MSEILSIFPALDLLAIGWFLAWWCGYTYVADIAGRQQRELARIIDDYRLRWMQRMLERENRMADVNIIIAHHRIGALFASTTILIMAGIVAVLGNVDRLMVVLNEFTFTALASRELVEMKVLALLLIFIYAFFKYARCLRQYNTALLLIGAAPLPDADGDFDVEDFAARAAGVLTRAATNFNRGMRSYYFALATLAWFIQPYLFMAAVIFIILVIYRRDYRSGMLKALAE